MNYFQNCKTHDEAKKVYRQWAMHLHPDKGGTEKDFQELNRQYKDFCDSLNNSRNDTEPKYDWQFDILQIISQLNLKVIRADSPLADLANKNIISRFGEMFGLNSTKVRIAEEVAKQLIKDE